MAPRVDLMQNVEDMEALNQLGLMKKWKTLRSLQKPPTKRPTTGCCLFLSDFVAKMKADNNAIVPRNCAIPAIQAWHQLSDDEKNAWNALCQPQRAEYQRQAEESKRVRDSMKKPPTAFGLFTKDRWKFHKEHPNRHGPRPGFLGVTKKIAREWKNLSTRSRKKYENRAHELLELFEAERRAILSGRRRQFNMNWSGQWSRSK